MNHVTVCDRDHMASRTHVASLERICGMHPPQGLPSRNMVAEGIIRSDLRVVKLNQRRAHECDFITIGREILTRTAASDQISRDRNRDRDASFLQDRTILLRGTGH